MEIQGHKNLDGVGYREEFDKATQNACYFFPHPPNPYALFETSLHCTKLLPVFPLPPFHIAHHYWYNFPKTLFMVFYPELSTASTFLQNNIHYNESLPYLIQTHLPYSSVFSPFALSSPLVYYPNPTTLDLLQEQRLCLIHMCELHIIMPTAQHT